MLTPLITPTRSIAISNLVLISCQALFTTLDILCILEFFGIDPENLFVPCAFACIWILLPGYFLCLVCLVYDKLYLYLANVSSHIPLYIIIVIIIHMFYLSVLECVLCMYTSAQCQYVNWCCPTFV